MDREAVRIRYDYRCGYCGITEVAFGGLLEVDHFQPQSQGGTDELENLIYACTTCNRFKHAHWIDETGAESLRLLHPQQDDLSQHLQQLADGSLIGLTPRGWFHIHLLRLNRRQLIAHRLRQHQHLLNEQLITQLQNSNRLLFARVQQLDTEVKQLKQIIQRLLADK